MPERTLAGDRDVEWGWAFSHLPEGSGRVLDFGPMDGFFLSQYALGKGHNVVAIGVEPLTVPEGVTYIRQDFLTAEFEGLFDYILNISTVEHVGLGRYGDPISPDGDLLAMHKLRSLMKSDAWQLLTIPIGHDAVAGHYHRVYGTRRLPRLLGGYRVLEEQYWRKADDDSRWAVCPKERALDEAPVLPPVSNMLELIYCLGCFVLVKG